jgi:cytochrome c
MVGSVGMKLPIIAIAVLCLSAGSALAQEPDLEAGASQFRKCMACHAVGEDATNRVGPVLNDVFGRRAGTYSGYRYSKVMVAAGKAGLIWTHETLAQHLASPRDFVVGNKMNFVGIKDETDLANVLAYLQTYSPEYVTPAE